MSRTKSNLNRSDENGRKASLMLMINKLTKQSAKGGGPSVNHL